MDAKVLDVVVLTRFEDIGYRFNVHWVMSKQCAR